MNFLSGQDDFLAHQTGNQPISVRHLSEPYNNKDLLTECEVCTGKYCLRFSYRPSDEGASSVR